MRHGVESPLSIPPTRSLLLQLIDEGAKLHGANVILLCETYPIILRNRLTGSQSFYIQLSDYGTYDHSLGRLPLRAKLAERGQRTLGLPDLAPGNIAVTNGATHGLYLSLKHFASQGGRVWIPSPSYSGYRDICTSLRLEYNGYPADRIESWIAGGNVLPGDIVIINTPHNPSGRVLRPHELLCLRRHCEKVKCPIIFDVVYDSFLYDGIRHDWACAYPEIERNDLVVWVNSFSKNFGLPGLRLGWITAHSRLIEDLEAIIEATVNCLSGVSQQYALNALAWDTQSWVGQLQARRDYAVENLSKLPNVGCDVPEAGTILMLRFERRSGSEVARQLLTQFGIVVLPGSGYYHGDPQSIRLSFGYLPADIDTVISALREISK
jgi:aspartate aminotransferase